MNAKELVKQIFAKMKSGWYLPVTEYQVYSTAETKIGVWTDGKPIYKRTLSVALPAIGTDADLVSGVDVIVSKSGYVKQNEYQATIPYSVSPNHLIDIYAINNVAKIHNENVVYYVGGNAQITLCYTKLNDSPISQSKVPFEPLVEYSTGEKMIGYWIDGKPLYRKTINFGTLPNNAEKNVAHQISNLSNVVGINGFITNGSGIDASITFNSSAMQIRRNGANINISSTSNFSAFTAYITLEYTKTTN